MFKVLKMGLAIWLLTPIILFILVMIMMFIVIGGIL